ncbi:hypothetical protein AGOR_G00150990 [Albula goreensis]|uniref:Chemokine interleukin-8-like domain-containing protein n=1 Tax=Albula goreensis TaxID=1534307 RepID=A0A8T3D975_9TELE|nr:hypothetical protein AGOR_G00150990 [Albula goreensis]
MNSKITVAVCLVLLAALSTEGMSVRGIGVELRCRCIETERNLQIARHIESVELFPPTSHCKDTEIIATLKETGQQVCLDTTAHWVKKVIHRMLANKKP